MPEGSMAGPPSGGRYISHCGCARLTSTQQMGRSLLQPRRTLDSCYLTAAVHTPALRTQAPAMRCTTNHAPPRARPASPGEARDILSSPQGSRRPTRPLRAVPALPCRNRHSSHTRLHALRPPHRDCMCPPLEPRLHALAPPSDGMRPPLEGARCVSAPL